MKTAIPPIFKERESRDDRIRNLYKSGYSMNQIVAMTPHSKTTIFRAIHKGRRKKKSN